MMERLFGLFAAMEFNSSLKYINLGSTFFYTKTDQRELVAVPHIVKVASTNQRCFSYAFQGRGNITSTHTPTGTGDGLNKWLQSL